MDKWREFLVFPITAYDSGDSSMTACLCQIGAEARYCPEFSGLQDPHITFYASSAWCHWRDLNPHELLRLVLSQLRLPFRHSDINSILSDINRDNV